MKNWPFPALVAHRGAGKLAPENTLAAFQLGLDLGYLAFECDVKLSSDGVPYLLHDATLDRTTSGKGSANDCSWAQLAQLDAGAWHSTSFIGEQLPTLEAIAQFVRQHHCNLNIEIKPIPGAEQSTGRVVALAAAQLWKDAPLVPLLSSFSTPALLAAKLAEPSLPRMHLFDQLPLDWEQTLSELECVGLVCNWQHLSDTQVSEIRSKGYRLAVYTCNDRLAIRRLLAWGVDSVITDAVDVIKPNEVI